MIELGDAVVRRRRRDTVKAYRGWKLEDAKARFSEVVRRAQSEGPQRVTVRGRDAVVVISAVDLERLLPARPRLPFVEFMESLYVEGLELDREPDHGRDVEL
jgi:prevent-host-death family protein